MSLFARGRFHANGEFAPRVLTLTNFALSIGRHEVIRIQTAAAFFHFRCSRAVFTEKELRILEEHGAEFARLANGQRLPKTQDQARFVEVARGQREPETVYEKAWAKYMWRVDWEQANRSVMGERRRMPDDRGDWKRMQGAVWGEARRRSQGLDDWTTRPRRPASQRVRGGRADGPAHLVGLAPPPARSGSLLNRGPARHRGAERCQRWGAGSILSKPLIYKGVVP